MAAQTAGRVLREESWTYAKFPMANGVACKQGGIAVITAAGKVAPATAATGLFMAGNFTDDFSNTTGADVLVRVRLKREVRILYHKNSGDVTAATVGKTVYATDDQTVSATSTGRSPVGICWGVDPSLGVAVENP